MNPRHSHRPSRLLIGGSPGNWSGGLGRVFAAPLLSLFGSRKLSPFLAKPNKTHWGGLSDLLGSGKVKPVIDRTYPLHEVPAAIRYLEEGHARGKVVIRVA